jgi:hypothetical protein
MKMIFNTTEIVTPKSPNAIVDLDDLLFAGFTFKTIDVDEPERHTYELPPLLFHTIRFEIKDDKLCFKIRTIPDYLRTQFFADYTHRKELYDKYTIVHPEQCVSVEEILGPNKMNTLNELAVTLKNYLNF